MVDPYNSAIPNYGAYGQAGLLAKTAYENTLARVNKKRTDTLQQYGYLGDVNPQSGMLQNLRVDPYNQYGGFQQMLRGQAQEDQQTEEANQARGVTGGLANKGLTDLRYAHGGQAYQLGKGLTGTFGDLQDEQNQAAYERDRALYEAQLQQAQDAIGGGDFNPGDYSGLDYPNYGQDPYAQNYPEYGPSGVRMPTAGLRPAAAKVIAKVTGARGLTGSKGSKVPNYGRARPDNRPVGPRAPVMTKSAPRPAARPAPAPRPAPKSAAPKRKR